MKASPCATSEDRYGDSHGIRGCCCFAYQNDSRGEEVGRKGALDDATRILGALRDVCDLPSIRLKGSISRPKCSPTENRCADSLLAFMSSTGFSTDFSAAIS